MNNNLISKLSTAFSTGGGGTNFEQRIQAMFLLSLLIDGFCPAMNEKTKRVCFQAKHLGYHVDDIVVFTYRNQSEGKLLCQVKHRVVATESNGEFQGFICAAWNDYNNETFDKNNDRIALVTAEISINAQQALRFLHGQALGSADESEFIERINLHSFSSASSAKMLNDIKSILTKVNNSIPSDTELWGFCKALVLLLFDMDCIESVNRSLTCALIKCNSSKDATFVWAKLVEIVGYYNQTAATIDQKNIDRSIFEFFSINESISLPSTPIKGLDSFIPTIALLGAWREDNEFDRQIIEIIAEVDYSDFEAKTRNMIIQNTEYLSLANGCWSIIHKEELLDQCKEMLFDDLIQKVIKATRSVLSQKSKSIMKQTPYYFNTTSEYDNSSVLRHSLIKSLCWIKKALPDLPNCNSDKIEAAFSQLVDSLLKDAEWSTLASLRDSFQYLAELAPDVFLNKIEWGVVNKSKDILHLFPQRSGEILADTNYLSELLWSLEVLAWSPDYLVRSVCILGLLENLPYAKTNWVNTPINSIVSILLPWHPQTIADFEKRKNALQCLKKDNPEVFWNVLMKLLPNHTRTTMDNPRPRYLSLNIPKEVKATKLDVQGEYSYLLELAIDTVCNEVGKLSDLTDQIEYMNEPTLANYLECIESNLETISQEERFGLWLNLRERIAMMKPSEEMVVYKQLDRILLLIKELEPEDIRLKYRELYLGRRYLFEKGDYSSVWERLENEKTVAVKEIFLQYGGEETERFSRAVNNVYDIADKLGRSLTEKELSEIIDACHSGALSKQFTAFCTTSFANTNGANKLLETSLCRKEKDFVLEILSMIPFSIGILGVVNQVLSDDSQYWEKALMPYGCRGDRIGELNVIVTNLTACHRYVTAINLVGRSEFESVIDSKSMYNLLMLAGTEKSIGNETIDNYAIQNIIGWFQKQESIDLELRSQVEFVYLPALDEYSKVQPHALNTRLSLDPEYFCSLLELFYKKNSDDQHEVELSKALGERLAELLFQFKVTPGIDWNGDFNETRFKKWMDIVKEWSKDNDRFVVAMHSVGSGLSYAPLDENRLPPMPIIEELNKVENNDLRRGYYLGILNQRGVHYIDPEGKPEFELAEEYKNKADTVETLGYSRYADILRRIASRYNKEAEENIQLVNKRTEE